MQKRHMGLSDCPSQSPAHKPDELTGLAFDLIDAFDHLLSKQPACREIGDSFAD